MKRKILWITIILAILVVGISYVYVNFFKRSPEKILLNQFEINLKEYKYSVVYMDEQWDYNGDGHCLILFDFGQLKKEELNSLIIRNFKRLPIVDKIEVNEIPELYLNSENGYYMLQVEKEDPRDFKIFIIDNITKKAIMYYQIM